MKKDVFSGKLEAFFSFSYNLIGTQKLEIIGNRERSIFKEIK